MQEKYPSVTLSKEAGASSPYQLSHAKSLYIQQNTSATVIGWTLRGGAILSATIILLGMLLQIHSGGLVGLSILSFPHSLSQVWAGLLTLQPEAVIALGILLLITTPVISVTTSLVAFAIENDRRFVVITFIVLAILITSLLLGKGGA